MLPLIQITADEVNHIIYSYLLDSGFLHTAFALKAEGRLEQSNHFNDHIPRGELVELLTKALLYTEVETHCKGDGLITDCTTPFSLLKRHECSIELLDDSISLASKKLVPPSSQSLPIATVNGIAETPNKRKADAAADGDIREKRSRRSEDTEELKARSADPNSSTPDAETALLFEALPLSNGDISHKHRSRAGPAESTANANAVKMLNGHTAEVFVCAWNPAKSGLLATGSKDATVRIWDLPAPSSDDPSQFALPPSHPPVVLKHTPDSQQRDITSLDWSANGEYLATGSYDSILRVWKPDGELHMQHPQHQGPIFATRFSKTGRWLLSSSLDGTACVWDVAERKLLMQFRCHEECCLDVDWLDDNTFASCGADKLIHIMQIGNTAPLRTFEGHTNEVNQIKFSPSRTRLASCSDDHTACIWSLDNLFKPNDAEDIPGLGTPATKYEPIVLAGHSDSIGCIGWCPSTSESHEILATASFDGTARLWNATTGECIHFISDHSRAAYSLAFSPDSKFFATAGGDGWLFVYEVTSGRRVWSWYAGPEFPGIYEIDWIQSGDINRIAMCLESKMVGVVDVTRVPALSQQ